MSNPWHEMMEDDPTGTTALLAQQVAAAEVARAIQQETGPLIQQAYENGQQQNAALAEAQVESAYYEADRALAANYGADWVEARDAVVQMVNDEPDLLSYEDRLSPAKMASRLDLLYKATREDRRQARDAEAFDRIKNAPATTYQDLISGRSGERE